MYRKLTFEEWKKEFRPIENGKIFFDLFPKDKAFLKTQSTDYMWTIHFEKQVISGFSNNDTDGFRFITEVPFGEDVIIFDLPEDFCVEIEWTIQEEGRMPTF